MPYPSPELLGHAAADLAGCHPLTIVTIPALVRARAHGVDQLPLDATRVPSIKAFGTKQERPVLEAFELREGRRPYLAVWQDPPVFINRDYPGSTLQRLRTQDLLGQQLFDIEWNDERTKRLGTALRPTAGRALAERKIPEVSRLSLALWLGRHEDLDDIASYMDWFDTEYPLDGTDLDAFYRRDTPKYAEPSEWVERALWQVEPENGDILKVIRPAADDKFVLDVPSTTPPKVTETVEEPSEDETPAETPAETPVETPIWTNETLTWTRDFCSYPLADADVGRITGTVLQRLDEERIVLPDAEALVRRCVTALLVGHLVLQGPPGTGKTTLARILAGAFNVGLLESTATSEWSPFHVVGGLRPAADNSLEPSYGKVSDAALKCAVQVRADVTAEAEGDDAEGGYSGQRKQGTWLLIDEFNRADIDKAIGSLYTVLSSVDPANLLRSPIDLWFEAEGRQQLWVPSRFRIIAAMNDLDTSFVNPISQGLTRRFQFITVGIPIADNGPGTTAEIESCLATAYAWLSTTYGAVLSLPDLQATREKVSGQIATLQSLIASLRETSDSAAGWPVGTAQVVDVVRVLLLQVASGTAPAAALDWCIADRLIPQMGQLDEAQAQRAWTLFEDRDLVHSRDALQHLIDPHKA
ncbi:AAA family ATPase [Streptomyces werraensis]|uniref:AAA family ATPase n=1 Tax=Streptomyces werraensis TaxID=68284 RepID=UPI0037D11379